MLEYSPICNRLSQLYVFNRFVMSKISSVRSDTAFKIWKDVDLSLADDDDKAIIATPPHIEFFRMFRQKFGGAPPTASSVCGKLCNIKQSSDEAPGDYAHCFLCDARDLAFVKVDFNVAFILHFILGAREGFRKKLTDVFNKAFDEANLPPKKGSASAIFEAVRAVFMALTS